MKAALNGVPSLSVMDGWWIEGHIEGVTGWSIADNGMDATSLYGKLEHVILPMLHNDQHAFIDVMRHAIALNGSFFNTQRNDAAVRGECVFSVIEYRLCVFVSLWCIRHPPQRHKGSVATLTISHKGNT